jgi:predicted nucleotidyltransferase
LQAAADVGELDELCSRHRLRLLVVFGSSVRDDPRPRDLDIAVATVQGERVDLLALIEDLVALSGVEDVDVLDLDRAGAVARERALVGTVPLYESEPGAFARTQMAAMLERMDTDWLRRLDLSLLAE